MSDIDAWLKLPNLIAGKTVDQIIGFVGEGRLKDGSKASLEFRRLLSGLPSGFLERYADDCLKRAFQDSGLALQDVINEVGDRLGFKAERGRYRGVTNQIGNDGIWHLPDGHDIVVEVKTTDAYRVDLDRIANYRRALIKNELMISDKSSILIIVGREDTGGLEAQIRGSRHAWDMRLISVDSLCNLMNLKEDLEDPIVTKRIYEILIPREFTKLDSIIEIVFSATEEVKLGDAPDLSEELDGDSSKKGERKFTPVAFNDQCVARIQALLKRPLIKRSKIKYASPDNSLAVVCAVSKVHDKYSLPSYWYAFHPHQQEFLQLSKESYVAFGCGSEEHLLLIPFEDFQEWLAGMNITHKGEGFYYHVQISRDHGTFNLIRKKGQPKINLTKYLLA